MLKNLNENKIFEELYIIAVFLIALAGWYFKTQYGYMAISTVALITVLLFNDVKYMVPCGFGMIFSIGTGFTTDQTYGPLICSALVYVSVFIIYIIRNGLHIKNVKSYKGLLALGILSFVPLLYHNVIAEGMANGTLDNSSTTLYVLYTGYIAYTAFYIFFAMVLRKDSFRMVFKTIGYMSILLSLECILYVLTYGFVKGYRVGWGHCNEAGILILFGIAFLTIDFVRAERKRDLILPFIKLVIAVVGIVASTSRGTYLFGGVLLVALTIYTLIVSKQRKTILISGLIMAAVALVAIQIKFGIPELVTKVLDLVFVRGLTMSDRFRLYKEACIVWNTDWLTRFFGAGMVAELTKPGFEDMNTFIMYHSTFFQCLATTGIVGVLALGYHFFERYRQLKLLDKKILIYVAIGLIVVDIYGMIDNTYGMYYFMAPVIILMAAFDNTTKEDIDSLWRVD